MLLLHHVLLLGSRFWRSECLLSRYPCNTLLPISLDSTGESIVPGRFSRLLTISGYEAAADLRILPRRLRGDLFQLSLYEGDGSQRFSCITALPGFHAEPPLYLLLLHSCLSVSYLQSFHWNLGCWVVSLPQSILRQNNFHLSSPTNLAFICLSQKYHLEDFWISLDENKLFWLSVSSPAYQKLMAQTSFPSGTLTEFSKNSISSAS